MPVSCAVRPLRPSINRELLRDSVLRCHHVETRVGQNGRLYLKSRLEIESKRSTAFGPSSHNVSSISPPLATLNSGEW